MTQSKRQKQIPTEPRPLWQRALAGERLPKRPSRPPKCEGTLEDHRPIALDVRELIRKAVFERPEGSVFHLNLTFPWLRVMRLNANSLDLKLVTGRTVIVPLVPASCGVMGEPMRWSARCAAGASACSITSTGGRRAAGATASGIRHSAPAVMVALPWPSGRSAASLVTTGSFGPPSTRRSLVACGGGHMRGVARRWSALSAK